MQADWKLEIEEVLRGLRQKEKVSVKTKLQIFMMILFS